MSAARPLVIATFFGMAELAILLFLATVLPDAWGQWLPEILALSTFGIALPGLIALHVYSAERFMGGYDRETATKVAFFLASAGYFLALPLEAPWLGFSLGVGRGFLIVGAALHTAQFLRRLPKSLTTDDPITKGDDACLKHLKFAHFILPVAATVAMFRTVGGVPHAVSGMQMAASHLFLIGFVLLSVYGQGHLWVPRLSGIPAIAAGAIKGELHTSLLGILGIVVGFSIAPFTTVGTGILVGLGFFVFVGMFTYMGVLGANIMKNKSKTQRVTPEFAYIPWTFSGVFWLISAVLLGLVRPALPDALMAYAGGATAVHALMALLGGVAQLVLAWVIPLMAEDAGRTQPPFHRGRWPFYAWNLATFMLLLGILGIGAYSIQIAAALFLLAVGLLVNLVRK